MMAEPPPIPLASAKPGIPEPTFFRALQGIWLFTWKSQLTWQRLPVLLLGLLALPVLIYLTTQSADDWSRGHSWAGNPAAHANDFFRRAAKAGVPLKPDLQTQILGMFTEEYARADKEPQQTTAPEAIVEQQREQINACYDRLRERAREVLNERQFEQFRKVEKGKRLETLARVNRPLWGRSGPFYHWLIDFYFFVILPLNCVRLSGALIRDELQADTLGFLITRPLTRARLLAAKYLTQTAWLQILMLVEAGLLFLAGQFRQIPALGSLLPLFLVAQFLAVLAWSALGTFMGLVTKRYMALAMIYGLIVEMGIGRIPTNINTLSLMRHLKTLLGNNPALHSIYDWSTQGVPLSIMALAVGALLFLGCAALLFSFREYHHVAEMQK